MINELGDYLIPVVAIGCTFMFLVIWVIAETIDSLYKTACNSRLKERLIERGNSASEIDQILRAGTQTEETGFVAPVPPVKPKNSYPLSG